MFHYFVKVAEGASGNETGGGLVSCSGLDCNLCKLFESVNNLLSWLLSISAAFAILFVVVGGLVYIGARGMESWMSQAKRTILWSVMGFIFVLVANLAVRTTMKVMGATNGFFDRIDCNIDEGALIPNIPVKSTSEILADLKSRGTAGGTLPAGTSMEEFRKFYEKVQEGKVVIYLVRVLNERKPIVAIGKKDGQTEILFVDRSFIQRAFKNDPKVGFLSVQEAEAASTFSNASSSSNGTGDVSGGGSNSGVDDSQKIISEVAQIMAQLVKKGREVSVVVVNRSDFNVNAYGEIPVNKLVNVAEDFGSCVSSGGLWSRFSNECYFELGECDIKEKCDPAKAGNVPVEGCQCPANKCRVGNSCVDVDPLNPKK